jgi:hypothetical protein
VKGTCFAAAAATAASVSTLPGPPPSGRLAGPPPLRNMHLRIALALPQPPFLRAKHTAQRCVWAREGDCEGDTLRKTQ